MFKKKKKDKQKTLEDKNIKNRQRSGSKNGPDTLDFADEVDGFDKSGFVDLQPIESNATILGPRQRCMYVGTFAVVSGTDGEKTLKTHKERTTFVKDRLTDYRVNRNGVDVMLQISSDGIKVFNSDANKVRMAYPLQRISFATCDPDFCLFAFMTYSPTPQGVAIHGHVFVGDSSKQVQDLTAMIGKAFKMAFASSKLQKRHGMNTGDIVPRQDTPVRRWAKHEVTRGHSHSEHASEAKKKVKVTLSNNSSGNSDGSPVFDKKTPTGGWRNGSPPVTPPTQRKLKGFSHGNKFAGNDDAFCDSISEMSITTVSSTESRESKLEIKYEEATDKEPYSPHRELDISSNYPMANQNELIDILASDEEPPPIPTRPRPNRAQSDPMFPGAEQAAATRVSYVESKPRSGTVDSNEEPPPIPTRPIPNRAQSDPMFPGAEQSAATRVSYVETKPRSGTMDRPTTHHDEYWYMPGIPREFVVEMLSSSEDGSFFVRDSQSRPGCHALTVRVPKELIPDGFANYLITPVPEGVKLESFSKTFPDLMTLIEYYSCHADELPCKLTLAGYNMLCDDDDDEHEYMEPADPDYQLLSDFHSMMDELR